MVEVIKAEVEEALARKFRKKAMEVYGYKKGAVRMALRDLMRRFVSARKAEWGALKGVLESELSSVELQHRAWKKLD